MLPTEQPIDPEVLNMFREPSALEFYGNVVLSAGQPLLYSISLLVVVAFSTLLFFKTRLEGRRLLLIGSLIFSAGLMHSLLTDVLYSHTLGHGLIFYAFAAFVPALGALLMATGFSALVRTVVRAHRSGG